MNTKNTRSLIILIGECAIVFLTTYYLGIGLYLALGILAGVVFYFQWKWYPSDFDKHNLNLSVKLIKMDNPDLEDKSIIKAVYFTEFFKYLFSHAFAWPVKFLDAVFLSAKTLLIKG